MRIERNKADRQWTMALSGKPAGLVSRYIQEAEADRRLRDEINRAGKGAGRAEFVQIDAPFELYALTRLLMPEHIVEIGVSAGLSSAYFLSALQRNRRGTLHSIDLPEKQSGEQFSPKKDYEWALPPGRKTGWAVPSRLKKRWDLRLGSSSEIIPMLTSELEHVDFFLYDVPYSKASAIADFSNMDRIMQSGGVVCVDNGLAIIKWWAERRHAEIFQRRGSGLRGFRMP